MRALERQILLQIIDNRWKEHLHEMDYLREGIHLRGFAQIDPLVAYKNEGFIMFEALMDSIWEEFARLIFHVDVELAGRRRSRRPSAPTSEPTERRALRRHRGGPALRARRGRAPRRRRRGGDRARPRPLQRRPATAAAARDGDATPPRSSRPRTRRSAATTPAGAAAGKKFKKCHGA